VIEHVCSTTVLVTLSLPGCTNVLFIDLLRWDHPSFILWWFRLRIWHTVSTPHWAYYWVARVLQPWLSEVLCDTHSGAHRRNQPGGGHRVRRNHSLPAQCTRVLIRWTEVQVDSDRLGQAWTPSTGVSWHWGLKSQRLKLPKEEIQREIQTDGGDGSRDTGRWRGVHWGMWRLQRVKWSYYWSCALG
jgi:hypothetical protein